MTTPPLRDTAKYSFFSALTQLFDRPVFNAFRGAAVHLSAWDAAQDEYARLHGQQAHGESIETTGVER